MSHSLQSAFLRTAGENSDSGSHCVSGCMYQVVPTIGTDGKNLLQLLPVPKSSGNLIPVVQPPVIAHALKGNTGKPVQVTFQTQISSSSTSTSAQLPVFQPTNTTNCFLTGTVETSGKGRVNSMETGSFMPPVSKVESHGMKIDGLTMQTFDIPLSTQNDSSYFIVNTPSLPVKVNSSILPSGHHLQIPADAQVKFLPASSLHPSVQQNMLGIATTSTSGTVGASQIPTVNYISPVHSVKNKVTRNYQNIYPKPVILNTSQILPNVPTETQLKGGQQSQGAPVKWNFQKNLQPHIPSLVPVKSSNNVVSKIFKTLVGRNNSGCNTIDTPLLSTSSSSGTQSVSVPIRDNTLIMFKGKVYLLAKKGTHGLPSPNDQENSVSSDTALRKDSSQIVSSSLTKELSREVINSVLVKSKSFQLKTKSLSNSQLASMANLRAEKNEKVERPSFTITKPHTMNQSTNCLKQPKTAFTNPVFPHGFRTGHSAPRKGTLIQSIEKMSSSVDAATVTSQQCVFRDQDSQTQYEMASIFKKEERSNKTYSEESNAKTSYLKNDAELKKMFGLTKDLRVCLTRIPDHLGSGKGFDSFSSLVMSSSYKDAESMVKEEERKQNFSKKRKAKAIKKMDYTKRRKIECVSGTVMNGTDVASSQLLGSVLPASDVSQQNVITSHNTAGEDRRTEAESCCPEKQEKGTFSSSTSFEQSSYFSKNYTESIFPMTPPELEETIRDEKIRRLKQILKEKEAALEEMRKKMHPKN
ncbi:ligand-dependent nuclear receptor-interacting factor 1 [Acomys russatus]|uniref:ligand-dependent nuclear receptor-interacting factor 1 n=1 Tax=Acomys russatus TaxID=60746 RepID=UPI0021E338E9|nr:ligand-dependent nuclear receptor-interacting factor 1 [Acomys russatus]